jgi:glycosyltransferase involved in cell wall biosynthesis
VVVNDASTDDTAALAARYADGDARIRLLNQAQNGGLAAARNAGIEHTDGPYILPLDADDMLHPQCLERYLDALLERPGLKMVYSDVRHFGDDSRVVPRPDMNLHQLCHHNLVQPTALYRRADYLATEGYRANVHAYEDWDFWLQLLNSNGEAYRIPEPLFLYRVKQRSMLTELLANQTKELAVRQNVHKNNEEKIQHWAPELLRGHTKSIGIFRRFKNFLLRFQ